MSPRSTSRRKKRRYLSLRRRLAAATPMESSVAPSPSITTSDRVQLDLFPLHPSTTPVEDDPHDEHLSRFFPSDDAFSLHSLLGPNSTSTSSSAFASEDQAPSSSSANYSACSSSYAVVELARAALRGRERWWAEEEDQEGEAASCGGATGLLSKSARRLSLKLDYDAILNDWSDNRPLFVDEDDDGLQVVPDLGRHAAFPVPYTTTVFVDVAGCHGGGREPSGFCTVPAVDGGGNGEAPAADGGKSCGSRGDQEEDGKPVAEEEEEEDDDDDGKAAAVAVGREEREARVMRYKEKRRHRLFSKRIRYEVRKLNAEKRPRSKGRFVKRDGDM